MSIKREQFESAVPNKTVFVDCNGREWKVLRKVEDSEEFSPSTPSFILEPDGGEPEEFAFMDYAGGIVDEGIGAVVELNHVNAHVR